MGIKRIVDTSFWTDEKVVDLFSAEDRYFMLYLLTNPHTTQLGIYKYNTKIMAFELGYSTESVSVLLDRFENKYDMIILSKETNEIAIKNYLRHSIIKGGKPVEDLIKKEAANIKNKDLLRQVFENIIEYENLNETIRKMIIKNDNENDNDNDNENEVSSTYRQRIVKTPNKSGFAKKQNFIPPTVEEIKIYCHERKNTINAETFFNFYESKGWLVGKTKMKDWKAAIRTWESKNNTPQKQQKSNNIFFEILEEQGGLQ